MTRKSNSRVGKPAAKVSHAVPVQKPTPVAAPVAVKAKAVKAEAPVATPAPAPLMAPVPVVAPVVAKVEPPVVAAPVVEAVTPPPPPKVEAPAPIVSAQPVNTVEASTPISKGTTPMANPTSFSPEKILTDLNARTKTAFEKSTKFGEDVAELTKGNLEAVAESAKIAAKGAETLAQGAAEYTKKNFETATAAMKRYSSVKSPAELFQLNSELAKSSFDSAVAEASKMSEAFTKLAGEIFQPLSNRYTVTAEKLKASAF